MKNINTSPDNRPKKIQEITKNANKILKNEEILKNFKKVFDKLIRFGQFFIGKIKNEKDFEEFLIGFENIFKELEIEKVYNTTTIGALSNFEKMDLIMQFFYISTPIKNPENFNFIKGGVCYHWVIFYKKLFEEIDKNNILEKELISFLPDFQHGVFSIGFGNKKFIIDPYAKGNFITKFKQGEKIYLGAIEDQSLFGEVKNKNTINYGDQEIKVQSFDEEEQFIDNIYSDQFINIKTYLNGNSLHLIVKDISDSIYTILSKNNKNTKEFIIDKEFALIDIVGLYMEANGKKVNNYKILIELIGHENIVDQETKNQLKIIADKINIETVFEKLGIKEDIEMFK
ncbi:hypothetical protein LR002_02675 [Candidatus Gracilibacteria bacterium]|nr:hypothetical protein [Candidatus Gracilibacteria bacterium]